MAASDITLRHLSSKRFRLLLLRGYETFNLMDNNFDEKKAFSNICFLSMFIYRVQGINFTTTLTDYII